MGNYNALGNRIKECRLNLGLSQSELAKRLNCTQAALSQYENGNREPGLTDLINIADVLSTTTDYLLGLTHISSRDSNVKMIGDYLGFTEESISKLHRLYKRHLDKVSEEKIHEEAQTYAAGSTGKDTYELAYSFFKSEYLISIADYSKIINSFICSPEFTVFVSCLENNLYLERSIYDLLYIASKQYEKIKTPFPGKDFAELAYSLVESGEDYIRRYSLNLFDAQTALTDFCSNLTQLEKIKKLEYNEFFYRKLHFFIYNSTRPMFEAKEYSLDKLEKDISEVLENMLPTIVELMQNK